MLVAIRLIGRQPGISVAWWRPKLFLAQVLPATRLLPANNLSSLPTRPRATCLQERVTLLTHEAVCAGRLQ